MANTYDPANVSSSARDQVRLLIGDTTTTAGGYIFEDEEIDFFVSQENSDVYLAAATACRAIATNEAKAAIAVTLLENEIDRKQVSARFLALAQEYERKSSDKPFSKATRFDRDDIEYVDSLTARETFDYEEASDE